MYIYIYIYIIIYTVLIICNCVFQVYNVYMTSFGMALGHAERKWPFASSVPLCHPKYYLSTRPIKLVITIYCKILVGKALANLAKQTSFTNILPCQIPNIFLTKTLKLSLQFTLPEFCTICCTAFVKLMVISYL